MDTKNIKDEQIRKQIITASEVYRDKLAGRVFLYVYGESYFEVVFSDRSLQALDWRKFFYQCSRIL